MTRVEQLRRTRIALATIMRLVEDGVLVRNTKIDDDFTAYMRQSTTLVVALKMAQEILAVETALPRRRSEGEHIPTDATG